MSCAIYNLLFLEWRPWLNRNSFSMGIGFGGDIYSMEGSQRLAKQNGNIILTDYPEGITPQKTTINYPFVCLTPLYRIDLGKPENRIALHIGPIVKFNFKGRLSAIGKNEMGEEVSYASKSLPLRPVTVDLSAFLYYKYICIYAQYSPCKIFKAGRGPQINTLSVGVGLRLY